MKEIVIRINNNERLVLPHYPVMISEQDNTAHTLLGYYYITFYNVSDGL